MPVEQFTNWEPRSPITRGLLEASVQVIAEYRAQGYWLTLRQLYYQLVSRDLIPNEQRWYKTLGDVVSKGRYGGYIDWDDIVDRGRIPVKPSDWDGPADILRVAASQYRLDRWEGQENYLELWCEKDALSSVLEPICDRFHLYFLANRGYSSSTAIYDAAQRLNTAYSQGRRPVVIYLGDHDPSGIDMSRDISDRLETMTGGVWVEVHRLALTFDQVQQYQPPPNPAKLTDSRAQSYIAWYGGESWELDALEPAVLDGMVSSAVTDLLDLDLYNERLDQEEVDKDAIRRVARLLETETGGES